MSASVLLILAAATMPARVLGEETATATATGLPAEADREVTRYMNLLIQDPRNDFLFGEVFRIYKQHRSEYKFLGFLKGAIKARPKDRNLWVLLGLAYREFRDYFLARKYFGQAMDLDPSDYFPRFLTADILLREGRMGEAIEELQRAAAVAGDPEDKFRARDALARAWLQQGGQENETRAVTELEAILQERTYDVETHWHVARLYEQHGLTDRAVEQYSRMATTAREGEPERTCRALLHIAAIQERAGDVPKAIETYRQALQLVDEEHWIREKIDASIRDLFRRQGRLSQRLQELEQLTATRPRDVELRKEAARTCADVGQVEQAVAHLQKARDIAPEDVAIFEEFIRILTAEAERQSDPARRQTLYAQLDPHYQALQDINNENLDYWVREGETLLKAGNKERALQVWKSIVREDETEARRYELVGRTLLRSGFVREGVESLRQALALDPSRNQNRMSIAEALLRERDLPAAEKELQSITQQEHVSETTWLRIAHLYQDLNYADKVRPVLQAAAEKWPASYDIQLELGTLYLDGGERDLAKEPLWKAFLHGPTPRARLLANLKLMKAYANPVELAQRHEEWLKKQPEDLTALMAIGDIYSQWGGGVTLGRKIELTGMGSTGMGQLAYKTVQAKDPLYLPAYEHHAALLLAADRFEDAVLEYRKMVVVNPVNKWAYWLRIGDLFADQGQVQEASTYWEFIRQRNFADPQLLYQLASRLIRAEQLPEALEMTERAVRLSPNQYRLHLTLGHLHDSFNDYGKAVESYTRALQLATSDLVLPVRDHLGETQRRYAQQLWSKGDFQAALQVYQQAQAFLDKYREITGELHPESPNLAVQIARCLEASGKKEDAEKAYAAAISGFPKTWVWMNPMTELWLPHFETLRRNGTHQYPIEVPAPDTAAVPQAAATLVAQAWPVTPVFQAAHVPGRILITGMDSLTSVDTRDLSFQRTPLPWKYGQRSWMLLFAPYVLFQPLAEPDANQAYHPAQKLLRTRAAPGISIHSADGMKPIGQLAPGGTFEPWPCQQGDILYFLSRQHVGGQLCSRVLGWNLRTGEPVWPVAASYASPSAVSLTGSSRYLAVVEANDETVQFQAIDSQSGKHLAAIDPGAYHFWRNPLILGDTFFSYDDFDGWLYAWRLPGGEPLYRLRFGTQAAAEIMALDPQTVLVHHRLLQERKIDVCAVDAPSGRIRWRSRLSLESIDRGPLLAKGAILYPYRYRPVPVGEPAYDKPGPFFRAARGILALDAQSGAKLADIDLMKLLDERTIQDIREVFYADDHLFLVTHTGRTFKLRLDLPRP